MAKNHAFKSKSNSTRDARRAERRTGRNNGSNVFDFGGASQVVPISRPINEARDIRPMEYRSDAQKTYHQMIKSHDLVFGTGPAGTGKSHVAADHAALELLEKKIRKIIVCRPAIGVGKGMGYLPGTEAEKFEPYFRPIRKILEKRLGATHLDLLIKNGVIEIAPLEFIRGDTFEHAFVLLDEAQNTTVNEMKTFLTRIGEYTTVVVDGDPEQIDIKEPSGLVDALQRFRGMQGACYMEFTEDDIIRSGLVKEIVKRYRRELPPQY